MIASQNDVRKTHIVIDSAGDLPSGWAEQYAIHTIPINIHFGEQMFLQGVDLSNTDFYRMAHESGRIPQTSQPTPAQFIDFYRRIAQPGDTVFSIHVTARLSGTYDSAVAAAREVANEGLHILPFDAASGSAAQGYMAREVRLMLEQGATPDEILQRLEFIRHGVQILLTLNTLEYARKSGRVKALQAALASLLNVKPVIQLENGVLDMAGRVRTRRKALDTILEMACQRLGERRVNAAVVHSEDPEAGAELLERVRQALNCQELILTELSVAIAANLGPGTVGIIAYPVE